MRRRYHARDGSRLAGSRRFARGCTQGFGCAHVESEGDGASPAHVFLPLCYSSDPPRLTLIAQITLAQSINERLSTSAPPSTSASDAPQTANNLASTSLASLGLISAPITADMISSADAYHHELAKELGTVLTSKEGGLMRNKGVMGLDEVWCLWNRARGVGESAQARLHSFSRRSR